MRQWELVGITDHDPEWFPSREGDREENRVRWTFFWSTDTDLRFRTVSDAAAAALGQPAWRCEGQDLLATFGIEGANGAYVHTDRALLERVVRNILDNAFKYTKRGSVQMACEAGDGLCRVVIADSGIGIPETEQQRVFEEFYQVGNAERDRRKGMGLGLSIVRRLATCLLYTSPSPRD